MGNYYFAYEFRVKGLLQLKDILRWRDGPSIPGVMAWLVRTYYITLQLSISVVNEVTFDVHFHVLDV